MSVEHEGVSQNIGPTARHWARQKHIRPVVFMDTKTGELKLSLNGLRTLPPSPPDKEVIHEVVVRYNQKANSKG
jgi:hypothetical protein